MAASTSSSSQKDNDLHSKISVSGVPGNYSAHFDGDKLTRIVEERRPQGGDILRGEYSFDGGRLLRYQGAKVATASTLDLRFDLQGALLSGRGPDVTDEDITAINTRAQLLRSHALAQRDVRGH